MHLNRRQRALSIVLSLLLVFLSVEAAPLAIAQPASLPAPTAAIKPNAVGPVALSAPAAQAQPLASALNVAQPSFAVPAAVTNLRETIQVTLFDSEDPIVHRIGNLSVLTSSDGTNLDRRSAPAWQDYSFANAWLIDPQDPSNRIKVTNIKYKTSGPDNFMPKNEPYVIVTLAELPEAASNDNQDQDNLKNLDSQFNLCIPVSKTAEYLHFEYVQSGSYINLNYQNIRDKSYKAVGPTKIYRQADDSAVAYFNVTAKRNAYPDVSLDNNPAGVKTSLVADISDPHTTIYRYKLEVSPSFKGNAISIRPNALEFSENTWFYPKSQPLQRASAFIWEEGQTPNNTRWNPELYNFKNNDPNKKYQYNNSFTFRIYHDKAPEGGGLTYQILLAALRLRAVRPLSPNNPQSQVVDIPGEVSIGAPQPFARYGMSNYPADFRYVNGNTIVDLYKKDGLHPPGYSIPSNTQNFINQSRALRPSRYYVQSYSSSQGWLDNGTGNTNMGTGGPTGYTTWWQSQIRDKVVGSQITKEIKRGPLAGATVTIKLVDAIPSLSARPLGGGDLNGWGYGIFGLKQQQMASIWNGFSNAMRVAYDVTISNLPRQVVIDTEWARTRETTAAVYDNVGVEDTQAYAARPGLYWQVFNFHGNDWQNNALFTNYEWRNTDEPYPNPNEPNPVNQQAFIGNSLPGTVRSINYQGRQTNENGDPHIKLRGNVINGFHNPKAASTTYKMDGLRTLPAVGPGSDGYGYEVTLPVVAQGGDPFGVSGNANNSRVLYGGISTVGVTASLMQVPLFYDYNGGTSDRPQSMPVEGSPHVANYNVDTNPIVYVPNELPYRMVNNVKVPARQWHLYYKDASTGSLIDTNRIYSPGSSFSVANSTDVGTRLSDKSGRDIVRSFVLKAEYPDAPGQSPLSYLAVRHLTKSATGSAAKTADLTQGYFRAVPGIYVQLRTEEGNIFPKTTVYQGDNYDREASFNMNKMVLLGSNKTPGYVVNYNYHVKTEAERWRESHPTKGLTAHYPFGADLDQTALREMIYDGKKLPSSVHINLLTPIDTYAVTPPGNQGQIGNLEIVFSDGSKLYVVGWAVIEPPIMTGLRSLAGPLGLLALGVIALLGASATAAFLYRRRKLSVGESTPRHAR